jgi:hypothetical protein
MPPAAAQDVRLPALVSFTGFVALEGTSQRPALRSAHVLSAWIRLSKLFA